MKSWIARSSFGADFGTRPLCRSRIVSVLTPARSAIGTWANHSYCARHSFAVTKMANSESRGATAVLKRQWPPSCCASSPKAGADRVEQRPLGRGKLVFGENGDAGRRHFLGGLFRRHGVSSLRFRSCCGGGYLNSSDLMIIGTTLVSSMTLPMST